MAHRLGLCVNGAVALGSYEAGVVAQIYADMVEIRRKGSDLRIDAIAGASAGSVTGLLLAQALAMDEAPASFTERVRNVWVERLGIAELLGDTTNGSQSLFDAKTLDSVEAAALEADATIAARAKEAKTPPVALWMGITNLQGIPYEIKLENASVIGSLYADYEPIVIEEGVPYRAPAVETLQDDGPPPAGERLAWKAVGDVAKASGAFPFAFQSHVVERDLRNYPDTIALRDLGAEVPDRAKFDYTDGGILNNNPLGRLIDAVSFLGGTEDDRTYLVIEPDPSVAKDVVDAMVARQGDYADPSKGTQFGVPPKLLAFALIQTYFSDALYRDLADALKTNQRLEKLLPLTDELARTNPELSRQILEASGFDYKRRIAIERIPFGLDPRQLAGAFASHFGGFFARPFREHDFALGCTEARKWFAQWAAAQGLPVPTGSAQAAPVDLPEPPGFPGVPLPERDRIVGTLSDRIVLLIRRSVPLGCLAQGLTFFLKRLVKGAASRLFNPKA